MHNTWFWLLVFKDLELNEWFPLHFINDILFLRFAAIMILYPIIYTVWSMIILPLRLTILLLEFIKAFILNVCNLSQNIWILFTSLSYGARPQAEKTAKASVSTLRLLWNDIFSQVITNPSLKLAIKYRWAIYWSGWQWYINISAGISCCPEYHQCFSGFFYFM